MLTYPWRRCYHLNSRLTPAGAAAAADHRHQLCQLSLRLPSLTDTTSPAPIILLLCPSSPRWSPPPPTPATAPAAQLPSNSSQFSLILLLPAQVDLNKNGSSITSSSLKGNPSPFSTFPAWKWKRMPRLSPSTKTLPPLPPRCCYTNSSHRSFLLPTAGGSISLDSLLLRANLGC